MDLAERLSPEAVLQLSESTSTDPTLRLPARLTQVGAQVDEKRQYLSNLLTHDPGVFLERHGSLLSAEQREQFEPLREHSYEVDFYLKLLEDQEEGKAEEKKGSGPSSKVKNRRLAKMARLEKEGFFDEEATRKRAPLLHHQYLGQYTPRTPKQMANTLHDQIIQNHEEKEIAETFARQKQQEDADGEAFEATLSESEDESDEDDPMELPVMTKPADTLGEAGEHQQLPQISPEEMAQNREDFRAIMEGRFLSGKDGGTEADDNSSLDDDWAKEQEQDRADQYFES